MHLYYICINENQIITQLTRYFIWNILTSLIINNLFQEQINASIKSIPRRTEERPPTYPNGWLPVHISEDIIKGQVKPIFALGHDLIIYRGSSGKVFVFDAYCPHLGANLGVGGTVIGDDVICPFHGWQFNNQGQCVAIPGLQGNFNYIRLSLYSIMILTC